MQDCCTQLPGCFESDTAAWRASSLFEDPDKVHTTYFVFSSLVICLCTFLFRYLFLTIYFIVLSFS